MGAGASTDVASDIETATRRDLVTQARSLRTDLRTRVRDALDEADTKKVATSVQNPLNAKPVSKMSLQELKALGPQPLRDELKVRGLPCDGDTVALARRVMDAHTKRQNADTRQKLQNGRSRPGKPAPRSKAQKGAASNAPKGSKQPEKAPTASAEQSASSSAPTGSSEQEARAQAATSPQISLWEKELAKMRARQPESSPSPATSTAERAQPQKPAPQSPAPHNPPPASEVGRGWNEDLWDSASDD